MGGRGAGDEDAFFAGGADGPPPRARRGSPLLARSPAFAVIVLGLAGWLAWSIAPDVAYFFSSQAPIDLGGPGAYRLDAARENRLAQVRGELTDPVSITVGPKGGARTVGRIAGTSLLVDRPGRAGPPVFEGRLLGPRASADYAEVAAVMRQRGAPLADRFLVLRDGERPRRAWLPVIGAALLALLGAINLRALAKGLLS